MIPETIRPVPWDTEVFGIPCYEITQPDAATLRYAVSHAGHYTVKIDPLHSKAALHRHGFYYVDTLIEPYCSAEALARFHHADCEIVTGMTMNELAPMCERSFLHGRFHRDFNLAPSDADRRYQRWLAQLLDEGEVFGLAYQRRLVGFIAGRDGRLELHALAKEWRGRGLAKYFWSLVCARLFDQGVAVVRSSISAANLPVLNLYSRLGFRFGAVQDVYHRVVT